ncbi:Uncharacterised protein [Serratia plymuthica]|nr:Uncharacterised protein [Serratia plymuthica]
MLKAIKWEPGYADKANGNHFRLTGLRWLLCFSLGPQEESIPQKAKNPP